MANNPNITAALNFLFEYGEVFELCIIEPQIRKHKLWGGEYVGGKKGIIAGWFNDIKKAAEIAAEVDIVKPVATYVTLNPCNSALLARANNRLKANVNRTKDAETHLIRWMFVDVDPVRPEGVCSSDKEKELALQVCRQVFSDLKSSGWPDPLVGDSGNGYHLIYPAPDSPDDIPRFLQLLSDKYSTGKVGIDTKVGNPARLIKLYGTAVRKGDSIPDRPHRISEILSQPESKK